MNGWLGLFPWPGVALLLGAGCQAWRRPRVCCRHDLAPSGQRDLVPKALIDAADWPGGCVVCGVPLPSRTRMRQPIR